MIPTGKKKFRTFRSGLYRTFFLSILFPTFFFAAFFSAYYNRTLKNEREKSSSYLLSEVSTELTEVLHSMVEITSTCYTIPDSINAITYFDNPDLQFDSLRIQQTKMNYEVAMYRLLNRSEEFEAASFFPANSDQPCYIASRVSSGVVVNTTFQYSGTEWYKKALGTKKGFFLYHEKLPGYLKYVDEFSVISAIVPIRSLETDRLLGVMTIDVRSSRFSNILSKEAIAPDDFLLIKAANGKIISENKQLNIYAKESLSSSSPFTRYRVVSTVLPGTDWTLLFLASNDTVITTVIVTVFFAIAIILMEILIGFMEYRRHIRRLLHDFDRIERTLMEYEMGNFNARAGCAENAELNRCVDALNELGTTLDMKIRNEYLAVIARQRAEYNALQAQINPHFLYNMLNGFIALNRMGESEKLEESILNLTKLFRYTCKGGNTATVSDEFDFVREYLALQQVKYEDRLEYVITLPKTAASYKIPKLILQPLVENSVKHGLEPVSRPVKITVEASVISVNDRNRLNLVVADNGGGCDEDAMTEKSSDYKDHVAVDNIRSRLQLFRAGSVLLFTCKKGIGVIATVSIPIEEESV